MAAVLPFFFPAPFKIKIYFTFRSPLSVCSQGNRLPPVFLDCDGREPGGAKGFRFVLDSQRSIEVVKRAVPDALFLPQTEQLGAAGPFLLV